MADAVTARTYGTGLGEVVHLTNICDTTGESAVVKVDKSATPAASGLLAIEKVVYNIQGFTYVLIAFDHTANDTAVVLGPGTGTIDLTEVGGIIDPNSSGGTGDIVLTTVGNSANDTYDITLHVKYYGT